MNLNIDTISTAMKKKGLSQTDLARSLDVSREAVSKWLRRDAVPRPGRVLRLAQLLELSFDDVYGADLVAEPVVAFRKKAAARTRDHHHERAMDMGKMLRNLAPHLPAQPLTYPAQFIDPQPEYGYVERAAGEIRAQMGLHGDIVDFVDIISFFADVHAILIPVMWGSRNQHENALHIHLPDSHTTWVYLNLDTRIMDFKFWMAHELAHVKAPTLPDSEAETFADMFAAELLFPIAAAEHFYDRLRNVRAPGSLILETQRIATEFVVSPVTVLSQMNRLADRHGDTGWEVNIHAATSNFNKQFADVNRTVFGTEHPPAKTFISVAGETFNTPFYRMLSAYLRDTGKQSSFVQRVLNINPLDAKSLHQALIAGETEDPA